MPLKQNHTLQVNDLKSWLRIDHDYEDVMLGRLLDAAADDCELIMNRDFGGTGEEVPTNVEIAILQIAASRYEHRDDESTAARVGEETRARATSTPTAPIPGSAAAKLSPYRSSPGL